MENVALSIAPFAVALITQGIKWAVNKLTTLESTNDGLHKTFIRFVAALFAFGSVVTAATISGQNVDAASIDTFAQAVLVFLGASGLYFMAKVKKQ